MKYFKKLRKDVRNIIVICGWILLVIYVSIFGNDDVSTIESFVFLGLLIVNILLTCQNHKIDKKVKKPIAVNDRLEKEAYQQLISNDFDYNDSTSNVEANVLISLLSKIRSDKFYNPNDLNFDIEKRINDLKHFANKKMRESGMKSFVAVDIETTGLSIYNDRIVQLSAVKVENFEIIETFNEYVNPGMRISYEAMKIHGITNEFIANKPTINIVFPKFLEFINSHILVIHNASFDYSIIQNEYYRVFNEEFSRDYICTMNLWKERYNQFLKLDIFSATLKFVAGILMEENELNEILEKHHDALYDAIATAKIFMKMI